MNTDKLKAALQKLELVNPHHLNLTKSGYGEFPDTYELTKNGVDDIIKLITKCIEMEKMDEIDFRNDDRL
jgi:hypothetical protein